MMLRNSTRVKTTPTATLDVLVVFSTTTIDDFNGPLVRHPSSQHNLYHSHYGMTKYITGRTGLTGAIVDITGLSVDTTLACQWRVCRCRPPPPPLLLSSVLIGCGGYMTAIAPPPLVRVRSPVTSLCWTLNQWCILFCSRPAGCAASIFVNCR